MLRRYIPNTSRIINYEETELQSNLSYEEQTLCILDYEEKKLCNKVVKWFGYNGIVEVSRNPPESYMMS